MKKTLVVTLVTSTVAFCVGDYLAISRAKKNFDIYHKKMTQLVTDLASTLDDPRVHVPEDVNEELTMKLKFHHITAKVWV